ncbi:MAG: hypothetical protein DGJ47_000439 [Rickettsiaceae bacterium]
MFRNILIVLSALVLTSCATILSGSNQNINVKVVDTNNQLIDCATCQVLSGNGMRFDVVGNPGSVNVIKSKGISGIECTKKGYRQTAVAVGQNFDKVSLVNVFFWPGFIVDAVSGSMNKYPSHVVVKMQKL